MRILVMTALAIALPTMSAQAQTPSQSAGHGIPSVPNPSTADKEPEVKADDKAYKSSLEKIPNSKQGYDPWHNMRGTPQSNNTR